MAVRTTIYRLYPKKFQEKTLLHFLDGTRIVYNRLVEICKSHIDHHLTLPSKFDLIKMTTIIRQRNPFLSDIHSECLRTAADRVSKAFESWRKRRKEGVGFPRFKSWKMFDSFTYAHPTSFDFRGKDGKKNSKDRLRLSKVGLVKYANPFKIETKCKTATVFRRHIGEHFEWYAAVTYETLDLPKGTVIVDPLVHKQDVGLDLGLENLVTVSDGRVIPNDRTYKNREKQLANAQKRMSQYEEGTPEYTKYKTKLAHKYKKLRNHRSDLFHKISRDLSMNYNHIVMEDLSVIQMTENSPKVMKKSYRDAAWNIFTNMISYKVAETGGKIMFVNPAYTSQLCSSCGTLVPKDLSVRVHECPLCGLKISRDLNAAINILNRGLELQTETGNSLKRREGIADLRAQDFTSGTSC